MSDPAPAGVYFVREGDTLRAIAKKTGTSVVDLIRFNGLSGTSKLELGQCLYLTREAAYAVQFLFLDALRHPIENLVYRVVHDGQELLGRTLGDGLSAVAITRNARSMLTVLVKDALGQWQKLDSVVSDYGKKIVTFVSPMIVAKGMTEPRMPSTDGSSGRRNPVREDEGSGQPTVPSLPGGQPNKNNPGVKKERTKGRNGEPVIKLSVDLPPGLMKAFSMYQEQPISSSDWQVIATSLKCDADVLKAIARVESKGRAFWRLNEVEGVRIPAILYERHKFKSLTKGKYDQQYKDLSGPRWKKGQFPKYSESYLKLINAYRLDPHAAIQACSWGRFQIMGDEWRTCGAQSIERFLLAMCSGELGQLDLLGGFIEKKAGGKLLKAVRGKEWKSIALYYNGKNYADNKYDEKIRTEYEQLQTAG